MGIRNERNPYGQGQPCVRDLNCLSISVSVQGASGARGVFCIMGNETSAAASKGEAEEANAEKLRAIQRMDISLRRKLRGGVQYNMKVVLKGPRGSGKSTLLKRLQGLPFTTEVRILVSRAYFHVPKPLFSTAEGCYRLHGVLKYENHATRSIPRHQRSRQGLSIGASRGRRTQSRWRSGTWWIRASS